VEEMQVDEKIITPGAATISFPPGKEKFEFEYTALSFLSPEKVTFRYKLEGFDRDWIDAGRRRVAYYTNIPPGDYRFSVMACNNDGVWNTKGASVSFHLQPHFYKTNWFYLLCILGAGFVTAGVHRLRVRQMKLREQELVRIVAERTEDLVVEKERTEEALRI